jgi:hypothetical protein
MSIRPAWIEQPQSTTELTVAQRNGIVISTLKEGNNDVVLSRYGDDHWDLSPFFKTVNSTNSQKMIQWRRVPSHFTAPLKAITYRYWLTGLPGVKRPVASTVTRFLRIPDQIGHSFRFNSATHSDPTRPLIPAQFGRP